LRLGDGSRVGRAPGLLPGAVRSERAAGAARRLRRTHQCAELHQRDAEAGRRLWCGREQGLDRRQITGGRRGTGLALAADQPGLDPAHVRVDDRGPLPESEDSDGAGGVVADSGQPQQRVDIGRDLPAVLGDKYPGALVQPQRPARVAELAGSAARSAAAGQRVSQAV
jgi:hypothetical protein